LLFQVLRQGAHYVLDLAVDGPYDDDGRYVQNPILNSATSPLMVMAEWVGVWNWN
jgi:hypothetical protein